MLLFNVNVQNLFSAATFFDFVIASMETFKALRVIRLMRWSRWKI